jgi:two-component system OmpR family sensor kinase
MTGGGAARLVLPIVGVGVAVLAAATVTLANRGPAALVDAVLLGGPGAAILLAAVGVQRSDLPAARYRRVAGWTVAGAGALLVVVGLMILTPSMPIDNPSVALTLGAGVGGFAGLLNGVNEARAIRNATAAEAERVTAAMADRQRERLEWVNHLLRHDILNDATVIRARADALAEDGADPAHVDAIRRGTDDIEELIRNVRTFLETDPEGGASLSPVDLVSVVEGGVESVASASPEATVTTDLPDRTVVRADGLLDSVVSNLLRNAVIHTGAAPTVEASVTADGDTATLRVTDDGPGLPEYLRGRVFEREEGGDHGFGLYLVGRLAERYGGAARVAETGPDGTTFAVDLPLVDGEGRASTGTGSRAEP